jgi:environmental stress-induced protein Ves
MPWRNGRGSTTELLVSPAGASLETFDFRLSMAQLDGPAPFSAFPGIDRLLLMLEGRVRLEIEGTPSICCEPEQDAVRFGGEQAVTATPLGSEPTATDLNLMIRRGRYRGALRQLPISSRERWQPAATINALLCRHGSVSFNAEIRATGEPGAEGRLEHDDVLLVDGQDPGALVLTAQPGAHVYLAELFRL